MIRPDTRLSLIIGIAVAGMIAAVFALPIPQDPTYHTFADQRELFGLPNFWNVVSNVPFLFVGIAGLLVSSRPNLPGVIPGLRSGYIIFFAGVFLIGLGSAIYHWNPTNLTLLWDRLPMTLSFMAFFAVIVGEHISITAGRRLLWPLLALGVLSVGYWYIGELGGDGDLRPYALIQFLPLLLIPVILILYRSVFSSSTWIWLILGMYAAAKATEMSDSAIDTALGLGGHAFKHILGALATLIFLVALRRRIRTDSWARSRNE